MKPVPANILLADDDPDDRMLIREALQEGRLAQTLDSVEDGEELLGRLRDHAHQPPRLILLDLNMPRKDGREALREIKSDPKLRRIPVVVLTTSDSEDDIARMYDLGASSFIVKPRKFEHVVEMMRELSRYWFDTVQLPAPAE
jgi:two-component system response regulator